MFSRQQVFPELADIFEEKELLEYAEKFIKINVVADDGQQLTEFAKHFRVVNGMIECMVRKEGHMSTLVAFPEINIEYGEKQGFTIFLPTEREYTI